MIIDLFPKSTRAKNRVKEHGSRMKLIQEGIFNNEKAILVESLENTSRNEKWMGWFTINEVEFSKQEINIYPFSDV